MVIQRVDENWIEGKLDDKVGIFPLHFTEVCVLPLLSVSLSFFSLTERSFQ